MKRHLLVVARMTAAACGGATVTHHTPTHQAIDAGVAVDAAAEAGPTKLEVLALKHDRLARGMREIVRREIDLATEQQASLPAFDADTCVRATFNADAQTVVMLQDTHAMTLANIDGMEGTLAAAGPVCFRKGDVATFRFTGQSHVRLVVWASP